MLIYESVETLRLTLRTDLAVSTGSVRRVPQGLYGLANNAGSLTWPLSFFSKLIRLP